MLYTPVWIITVKSFIQNIYILLEFRAKFLVYSLMKLSPSWEAANCAATPTFYGTRRFITVFTKALHWSLSWARSIQCIPSHPIFLRSILILFTHLSLGHHIGVFPSGFPTNILYAFLFPHSCYMPFPSHPPWFDNSNYTWRRVQAMKLLLMQFSPTSCHFISLLSKYSPQHPVLKHPQSMFLPLCHRQSFTPIQNNRQNYSFVYSNCYIFRKQTRGQRVLDRMEQALPE
jgi:hypothetical protein